MRIGHALRKLWRGLLLVCAAAMLTAAGPGAIPAASPDNPEQVLYSFCQQTGCSDGATPHAGLITDSAGNLYGTTYFGGNASNAGTVFQLTPNGSGGWTETPMRRWHEPKRRLDHGSRRQPLRHGLQSGQ